jgi:photosystem II stability/assembly factor-like uncharacterized protein
MKLAGFFCMMLLLVAGAAAQGAQAKPAAPKPATGTQPKYKAIWERVPFNKDVELTAISCVAAENCWAAGAKSTILHTADGGKTWEAQLGGDPEATEEDFAEIFFLDAKHGWALTERSGLMATTDGSTWADLGKLPSLSRSIRFISPQTGFLMENSGSTTQSKLQRTEDGGKTWKPVNLCTVDATVGGLPRKLQCMMRVARFLSPTVGFLGGGAEIAMATRTATFAKTADGGQTWTTSVIPDSKHQIVDLLFWSEQQGLAVLDSGLAYWTADGGATWTGTVNAPRWRSFYASGEGKILVGVNRESGQQIGYSFNGGRNFTSRPFGAPAEVRAVTFFDARNGYLVGKHGMAYRYRIVPADYTSPGMIGAAAPSQ